MTTRGRDIDEGEMLKAKSGGEDKKRMHTSATEQIELHLLINPGGGKVSATRERIDA